MSQPDTPLVVRVFVATLTLLAVGTVAWAVRLEAPEFGLESVLGLAVGILAVWIVRVGMRLRRFRGERSEMYSYEEALFPLLLVTIGPEISVVAFAMGTLVVYLRENTRRLKVAFNVSQFTLAAAGGGWVASLIPADSEGWAVVSVLAGAGTYALLTVTIFGTLMGLLSSESWSIAVMSEVRDTGQILVAQVLLGVTGAVALSAVPASTPVVILTLAVVLHMHARWYQLTRDREKIDDLLHATVDLHGSMTTDEVARRLSGAIYTLISADAELLPGTSDPPAGAMAFEVDAGDVGLWTLVVRRDAPLEPTAIAICEALARVAAVSYRMAALLEEREEQAAALHEVIAEREAFLTATAHQLRTPLTAMVGFSSLLWQEPDDPQVIKEMMSHLVAQAGEMTHHLDNLLISSRSLTDSVMISRDDVDIRIEAERAVAALPPGRSLVSVLGESGRTYVDPVRLRHILRNLLVNAQAHGGSLVEVHTGTAGGRVWIEVRDNGPGLSKAAERRAFESARAQGRDSTDQEGVGLGLHVARLLARLMGGDVTYRRSDGWTVFRVEFPGS